MEEFFDNYTTPSSKKNYTVYSVKYELFWNNITAFNNIIGIPDVKEMYPVKQERPKRLCFVNELTYIYRSLIHKMNNMKFIEIITPLEETQIKNDV
jgi:hypothetical protein